MNKTYPLRLPSGTARRVLISIAAALLCAAVIFSWAYLRARRTETTVYPVKTAEVQTISAVNDKKTVNLTGSESELRVKLPNSGVTDLTFEVLPGAPSFEVTYRYFSPTRIRGGDINYVSQNTGTTVTIPIIKGTQWVQLVINPNRAPESLDGARLTDFVFKTEARVNVLRCALWSFLAALIAVTAINYRVLTRHLALFYCLAALGFGILYTFITPVYFGFDEREHFVKAYETAALDLRGSRDIAWPESFKSLSTLSALYDHSSDNYDEYLRFIDTYDDPAPDEMTRYNSTATTYLFLPYVFYALGIALARLFHAPVIWIYYAGKIANVVACSLIGTAIIHYARHGRRLIFALLLLPGVFYTNVCYSADPVTTLSALGLCALFFNFYFAENHAVGKKQLLLYSLYAVMMISGKVTYFPLTWLILAVPADRFAFGRAALKKWALVLLYTVLAAAFFKFSASQDLDQWGMTGIDVGGQIRFVLTHPLDYARLLVRWLVNNAQMCFEDTAGFIAYAGRLPAGLSFTLVLYLVWTGLTDPTLSTTPSIEAPLKDCWLYRLALFAGVVGSWILVCTALYLTFIPVGVLELTGVQGRYFAPLIVPFLAMLHPALTRTALTSRQYNLCCMLMSTTALGAVAAHLITLYAA